MDEDRSQVSEEGTALALHVDSEDDDLDRNTGRSFGHEHLTKRSRITPAKKDLPLLLNKKIGQQTTKMPKKPGKEKQKMTVASRLNMIQSPMFLTNSADIYIITENDKIDQEVRQAKEQLEQAQMQAEMAKKKLQADETHRQTLTLQ